MRRSVNKTQRTWQKDAVRSKIAIIFKIEIRKTALSKSKLISEMAPLGKDVPIVNYHMTSAHQATIGCVTTSGSLHNQHSLCLLRNAPD